MCRLSITLRNFLATKKVSGYRSACWKININNPNESDKNNILAAKNVMQYMIFKPERGHETGTKHLEGYVECANRTTLSAIKELFPRAHIEKRRGTQKQAITYCKKEDTACGPIWEYGIPYRQGHRTDIKKFIKLIKDGKSNAELMELEPELYVRYPNLPDKIRMDMVPTAMTKITELRPWQSQLDLYVQQEPDPRKIRVYVDKQGGQGKTEMTKYLIKTYHAFLAQGKSQDILYAYQF